MNVLYILCGIYEEINYTDLNILPLVAKDSEVNNILFTRKDSITKTISHC